MVFICTLGFTALLEVATPPTFFSKAIRASLSKWHTLGVLITQCIAASTSLNKVATISKINPIPKFHSALRFETPEKGLCGRVLLQTQRNHYSMTSLTSGERRGMNTITHTMTTMLEKKLIMILMVMIFQ